MKRNVHGFLLSVLCLLALSLTACSSQQRLYTIGAFQMISHPAIDAVRAGFVQALADAGYEEGENVRFDFQNAEGEIPNTQTIARKFVADQVDMIFAIGTPPLHSAVEAAPETMPVVFAFVSDPWGAGAGTSVTEHLPNVTGILNTSPVEAELALIKEILLGVQRVGLIYNAGEPNSRYEAGLFKEAAAQEGLEVIEQTVAGADEVVQAAQALASQGVQAFPRIGDYATATAYESIVKVGKGNGIPAFSIDQEDIERGALAVIGWDRFEEGYAAGQLAVRMMKGESPADIPFQWPDRERLSVSLKAAETYGVTVPETVVERADKVIHQIGETYVH
jgi:putative ABC transport system substrate-binding protein